MKVSLINQSFNKAKKENRPALLTYTVAGDSTKNKSLEILKSISKFADICELGFPHNTPIADGGQIQTSAYRALKSGIKINDVFSIVRNFKRLKKNKPIILMGYYNMIYQYNENRFITKCKNSKVDGLIVVDLPYPENKSFALKCKKKNINFIQLISPTTSKQRVKRIVKDSHDMIYYISMLSTTGGKLKVSSKKILKEYSKIKDQNKSKNVVIGFGITEKTIKSLKKADGLVVGSEICKKISSSIKKRQNAVINVTNLVKRLKNKIK
ncbi:tryptophan synthase subunit alpha [Candidatus Pelagibacter sp.]|nr:tryptophan synthase subunit alpha [Candidatus Pelagibacter sp.]